MGKKLLGPATNVACKWTEQTLDSKEVHDDKDAEFH